MAALSSARETPLLAFLDFVRAHYDSESGQASFNNFTQLLKADLMLNKDIERYELYLSQENAYPELEQFLRLCHLVREEGESQTYDFIPPSQEPSVLIPSFAVWRSQTSNLGSEYQYPAMYDTYLKYISGPSSEETVDAYLESRERVTEGDRRVLYGLSRHDLSLDMQRLQIKRHLLRYMLKSIKQFAWVEEWSEHFLGINAHLIRGIVLISILMIEEASLSLEGHGTMNRLLQGAYTTMEAFWARQNTRQIPLAISPAHATTLSLDVESNLESEENAQSEVATDHPLSRFDWQQLALQVEADHIRNMTSSELLEQLREIVAEDLEFADLSDVEDENSRIRHVATAPLPETNSRLAHRRNF
ncbi:hypothetical protein WAI453_004277 [Rhynchosporium graminicola]|uniref:Uncharacterized protein n=1 Tax=Rhynchosporium graminicola TaxID=2792576 RepID=A0A1E1JWH6_9HELO|nr:uncharacterized protein RCO7_08632 [Rhynchosporium commune]